MSLAKNQVITDTVTTNSITYNLKFDAVDSSSNTGLFFRYAVPAPGKYVIDIDGLPSRRSGLYVYVYQDSNSSDAYAIDEILTNTRYLVTASKAGQVFYIEMFTKGFQMYGDVTIRADVAIPITILPSEGADFDTIHYNVLAGDTITRNLPSFINYVKSHWIVQKGPVHLSGSTVFPISFEVQDTVIIQPVYTKMKVVEVFSGLQTVTLPSYRDSSGVVLKYSKTKIDSFRIKTSLPHYEEVRITQYKDSLFKQSLGRNVGYRSVDYIFSTAEDAGSYYFTYFSSSWPFDADLTVDIVEKVTVKVGTIGEGYYLYRKGSTSSRIDNEDHYEGDIITLVAYPERGYTFSHWSKTSGEYINADSTDKEIKIKLSDDLKMTAIFFRTPGTPLAYEPVVIHEETLRDMFSSDSKISIHDFEPEIRGNLFVELTTDDTVALKSLIIYRDTLYNTWKSDTTKGQKLSIYIPYDDSLKELYFLPQALADSVYPIDMTIRIFNSVQVEIDSAIGGRIDIDNPGGMEPGSMVNLHAKADEGFTFKEWVCTRGDVRFENYSIDATAARVLSNGRITAHFERDFDIALTDLSNFIYYAIIETSLKSPDEIWGRYIAKETGVYNVTLSIEGKAGKEMYKSLLYYSIYDQKISAKEVSGTGSLALTFVSSKVNSQHYLKIAVPKELDSEMITLTIERDFLATPLIEVPKVKKLEGVVLNPMTQSIEIPEHVTGFTVYTIDGVVVYRKTCLSDCTGSILADELPSAKNSMIIKFE